MDNIILIEGGVILAFGVAYVVQNNRPVTPVFVGAIGLMFLVSLMEIAGGPIAEIGKALLSLATFSVVIAEGGTLVTSLQTAQKKVA